MKKTNILFSLSLLIIGFSLVLSPSSAFAYGEYGNYNNGYGNYNNGYAGNTWIAGNDCYTSCGYNNNYNNGFGNYYNNTYGNYNNNSYGNYNNGYGNYNNGYAGNTWIAGNGCYTSCGYNNNYNNGFGNYNYNNSYGNYNGLARW